MARQTAAAFSMNCSTHAHEQQQGKSTLFTAQFMVADFPAAFSKNCSTHADQQQQATPHG
jgi:hypothetical protein